VVVALGGLTMRRNLDWRDGRTLYERLLPLAPDSMRVRVNLAEAYQQAGELDRARVAYEEVLRRRPNEHDAADALNNLGNLERGAGRTTEALAAYDRALALQPRHVAARRRARLGAPGPRAQRRARASDAALALDPTRRPPTATSATSTSAATRSPARASAYLAAVRLDPGHADAHNNLGSAYFRLGDRARAEAEYRTTLRLDPRSAGAERNLAIVLGASPTDRPGP
jgi:tetratricopeptide (TPR) repeat protein